MLCSMLQPDLCCLLQAFVAGFEDVAAYLWQAVSKMESLSASGTDAMDTGLLRQGWCMA